MKTARLPIPNLAPAVVEAALRCIHAVRPIGKQSWIKPPDYAVIGTVEIVYQAPDILTHTFDHRLEIWKDHKSVLHATWEREAGGPYKRLMLRRGTWLEEIMRAATGAPPSNGWPSR